jgi:hypothetical protein
MKNKNIIIYENINSPKYISLACTSILGGIISNIGLVFFPFFPLYFASKAIIIGVGTTLGYKLGDYCTNTDWNTFIRNDNIWQIIFNYYSKNKKPIIKKDNNYTQYEIINYLIDTRNIISDIYQFCYAVLLERYECLDIKLLKEIKCIAVVICKLHPLYNIDDEKIIYETIERYIMDDFKPYLIDFYIKDNKVEYYNFYLLDNIHINIDYKISIDRLNIIFRQLLHHSHPSDKIKILLFIVKEISRQYEENGLVANTDDLIPILSCIILENKDIIPSAQLKLIYDYLGDGIDESAYTSTILLSSLEYCNSLKNIKNESISKY